MMKGKKILKRVVLTVVACQFCLSLLLYTPLFILNNLQSTQGTERVEQNLIEQEELFNSPVSWGLLGIWNIGVLYSLDWFKNHNQWRNEHYGDGQL